MKILCGKDLKTGVVHAVTGEQGWHLLETVCGVGNVWGSSLREFKRKSVTCPTCQRLVDLEKSLNSK